MYLSLAAATVVAGLVVHWHGEGLAPAGRDVLGDVLWAIMIAWLIGAASPSTPLAVRAASALAVCFAVETSQLYHAPWVDALRETTLGQLALGSGFDVRDLVAYTGGVCVAALLDCVVRRPHPAVGGR